MRTNRLKIGDTIMSSSDNAVLVNEGKSVKNIIHLSPAGSVNPHSGIILLVVAIDPLVVFYDQKRWIVESALLPPNFEASELDWKVL